MQFKQSLAQAHKKRRVRARDGVSARQSQRALLCGIAIGIMTLAFLPVSAIPLVNFPDFMAAYQTAMIAAYLIAAYLIFGFFRAHQTPASLYLCGGCLYAGVILLVQALSFPNAFSAQGMLPGGAHSSLWLWCFWHAALPSSIALYALSEWRHPGRTAAAPQRTSGWFAVTLTWLLIVSVGAVTMFPQVLPLLDGDGNFSHVPGLGVVQILLAITVTALLLLWRATRFRTALHAWLGIALIALLFDNVITIIGGLRWSVGWYVGHINALISAVVMLLIHLSEINRAYLKTTHNVRHLASANALLAAKVEQAGRDFLTGLPGRALLTEQVQALTARHTGNGTIVAVMLVDLDGFKKVNDTFGHDKGDQILVQTAGVLRSTLRSNDVAARFGGDEFVVCLFVHFSGVQATMINIAGRIIDGVGQLGHGIGCSIGISLYNADRFDLSSALQQADEAMYMAKNRGKNRFVVYGQPLAGKAA